MISALSPAAVTSSRAYCTVTPGSFLGRLYLLKSSGITKVKTRSDVCAAQSTRLCSDEGTGHPGPRSWAWNPRRSRSRRTSGAVHTSGGEEGALWSSSAACAGLPPVRSQLRPVPSRQAAVQGTSQSLSGTSQLLQSPPACHLSLQMHL